MDLQSAVTAVSGMADVLAIVPNPAPIDPTGGSEGVPFLLGVAKWGALIASGLAGVVSGALIAVGGMSRRAEMAQHGKVGLICALIGVVVSGTWIMVTNTSWSFFA
jgi:hypothetical protein